MSSHPPLAGHPTRVHRLGRGNRQALGLHCSLAHGGAWTPLSMVLPDLTIHAPDFPGHGESADWPGQPGLHDLSTDIAEALLRDLARQGPVDVLGHSFGATVALRLALRAPALVRSLVLFEPVLFCAARGTALFDRFMEDQADYGAAVRAQDWPEAARLFNRLWGMGDRWSSLPEARRGYLTARMPLVAATDGVLFDDTAAMLSGGALKGLRMPILLAEGAASPPVIGAIMDGLQRAMPRSERLILPAAGHMLPITHPAGLGAAVSRLLAKA